MKNKLSIYFDFISTASRLWCVSPFADVGFTLFLCRLRIWKHEQERVLKITLPQFYSFSLCRKLNLAMTLSFLATTPVTRFIFNDFHDVTGSPFQGWSKLQAKARVQSVNICLLQCSCCSAPSSFLSAFSEGEYGLVSICRTFLPSVIQIIES